MSFFPSLDARPTSSQEWQIVEVPIRNTSRWTEYCQQHRVSILGLLQGAWALLLRRYIGDDSVSYGCLLSTRDPNTIWDSSSNVLTYQVDFKSTDTVLSVLQKSHLKSSDSRHLGAKPHFVQVNEDQQTPVFLFDTALQIQDLRAEHLNEAVGCKSFIQDRFDYESLHCIEILVDVVIGNLGAVVHLHHRGSKLSTIAATNVAHTYSAFIECIMEDPSALITSLDALTKRDSEQLRSWNGQYPETRDVCVHDLVLHHVRQFPDSPAICSWDGHLTYDELENVSASLACYLLDLGVAPEVLVPICFEKSMWAIVTMVAILRAGGAFVPLDPSHPKDRLEAIVQKTQAKLVIGSPATITLFGDMNLTAVAVSRTLLDSFGASHHLLPIKIKPYNTAFVLFTSGSTGKPKGIVQEHASVCTSSLAHGKAMKMTSESRVLQYAAYTFDVSMMDIFTTLIYGGCICCPSEEDRISNISGIINEMQVNWALFTPSVAGLIVPEEAPTLQTLALGGEAVTPENIARWADKVQLFNCYGPAECAACVIGLIESRDSKPAVIGRPFGCGLCWVADPANHDRLVPIGAVGELLVEGPTLARSYLDDMEKTRASFIKTPKWPVELAGNRTRRLYKTGDLVRQNSNGAFDFVGRKDLQVKVRGQRVEISEVEHYLSLYPQIALAIVASPKSGPYTKSLVAIIQLQQPIGDMEVMTRTSLRLLESSRLVESSFNVTHLTTFLKSKLPIYMVPSHWFVVERIPLSVSGKIDRKAGDQWLAGLNREIEFVVNKDTSCITQLPANDTISRKVSSKLTSLVYPGDDLASAPFLGPDFLLGALGLDSIQIISLIAFVKREFGVRLDIGPLLRHTTTIRAVAQSIENAQAQNRGHENGTGHPQIPDTAIDIMAEFKRYKDEMVGRIWGQGSSIQNVFLTGATGFLGSQILFQLCTRKDIRKVMLHVRARNVEDGLQRIKKTASLAGWWSDSLLERLEVWTGDLGQPRLGLHRNHWDRLTGNAPVSRRIHAIIHSGATVHWNTDFGALRAANVDSTLDLLKVVDDAPSILKFVYVSGGYHGTLEKHTQRNGAQNVVLSTGYAQTKYLSQLLVQEYSQSRQHHQNRVSIVKPSYIIGTVEKGIANIDDFIWRLIASCIQIQGFNEADADGWLYISDVDRVATRIVDCCDTRYESSTSTAIEITEGILVSELWSILADEFGYKLAPMKQDAWLHAILADIDAKTESHPLWPLIHSLEKDQGRVGLPVEQVPEKTRVSTTDSMRVKAAIRRNVQHLREIGFLAPPHRQTLSLGNGKAAAFTRSRRVGVAQRANGI